MKTKLLAILLLFTLHMAGQERATLMGRVMVDDAHAPGVFVINKNTGTEVKTDNKGEFLLPARNGDRLVVYSNKTVVREFTISADSFKNMPYELAVEPQAYELEEVIITDQISAESLGLVPEGQKRYTVAERRLKTAGEFKPTFMFFLGGGVAFPLDPIINAITGRTKMLKKELVTERKIMGMENINNIYTEQITSLLGIPAEKIQAFLFYAVEDAELARAIKNKNDERAKLELSVLAGKYITLQQEEATPAETPPATQTAPSEPLKNEE
jgi:hypothetical protein